MPEWKNICCAVDFSELSGLAMLAAAYMSRTGGADLTLVHVYTGPPAAAERELHARAIRELEEKLAACRRQAEFLADRPVQSVLLEGGDAGTEVLRFARESSVDLIVMGTHGRTGVKHLALGSVAEIVVRRAECAVLVMREKRPPAAG